ncbi:hypothetical protein AB0C04_20215 [Micromonospora sp. NPDC048909]|uniref:hypothetical protein n=1 Tax=Micromonospora sp. NPDC048909 TaxID=3155643 RepID=UPI0033D2E77C
MLRKQDEEKSIGRRRLLRRAGAVAAGMAGAGVAGAASATPAQAAAGDPVIQGVDNVVETATTLRNTGVRAALRLANDKTYGPVPDGRVYAEPALQIKPSGTTISHLAEAGSISMAVDGNIWVMTGYPGGSEHMHVVHTTANSNRIVPLVPQRVLDTRYASSRGLVRETGYLDSSGRLLAGRTISLRLTDHLLYADAVFGTVTVVQPTLAGFAQVYPFGITRPTDFSSINFAPNQILSNAFVCGVGSDNDSSHYATDLINVYSSVTAHIIVDLTAAVVGAGRVNPRSAMPVPASRLNRGGKATWEE